MKRVLLVGLDPATVDFSDPALPPGMTADKIHAGIKLALADMTARGWLAENCFITPDGTAVPTVERRLADSRYDCVVIGAGVRLPPSRLALFEALVNAIHRAAPQTAIAFNTRPDDTGAAAARWIGNAWPGARADAQLARADNDRFRECQPSRLIDRCWPKPTRRVCIADQTDTVAASCNFPIGAA